MSDQKIDVDALIERLRAAWRSGTEREAADALSTLKAERDAAVADRDKPYVSRSLAIIKERDALRADLERARKALRKAAGYVTGPETESLSAVKTEITAVLSPTAPVTGEKEPPGAVLDRAQASLALVEAVINSGRSEEWLRNFETALIAAAKARSTANG